MPVTSNYTELSLGAHIAPATMGRWESKGLLHVLLLISSSWTSNKQTLIRVYHKTNAFWEELLNSLPVTVNLRTPTLTGLQEQGPEERETTALVVALKASLRASHRLDGKTPERCSLT
jgi:hypothetical protein